MDENKTQWVFFPEFPNDELLTAAMIDAIGGDIDARYWMAAKERGIGDRLQAVLKSDEREPTPEATEPAAAEWRCPRGCMEEYEAHTININAYGFRECSHCHCFESGTV